MAAQAAAPARRVQVGLGGDGVELVVLQIADIGDQFAQSGGQVRRAAVAPAGHLPGQAVHHQAAQAGVIACQVVDVGSRSERFGAVVLRLAVEVAGAFDLEGKVHRRQARVEVRQRGVQRAGLAQTQAIGGVIAFAVGAHHQHMVGFVQRQQQCLLGGIGLGRWSAGDADPFDVDLADTLAAGDAQVVRAEPGRYRLQQAHQQGALARAAWRRVEVEHFQVVDAVEARMGVHQSPAVFLAAVVDHAGTPCTKLSARR